MWFRSIPRSLFVLLSSLLLIFEDRPLTTSLTDETAFNELFKTLDEAEELLGRQRYVAGDRLTEADIRLFCTLIRFDAVYFGHFKCNRNRIEDFHNLSNWLREIYQTEGVRQTVDMNHIKQHYHRSQPAINPFGIVPVGPILDFDRPHDRASRFSQ